MFNFLKQLFYGKPFTIYISDSYVQVIKLSGKNSSPQFTASGQTPLKPGIVQNGEVLKPQELAQAIQNLLAKTTPKPIKSKSCQLVFPNNQTFEQIFHIPISISGAPLNKQIEDLVRSTVPIPYHELKVLTHQWTLDKVRVVAVTAARIEVVAQYYEVLKHFAKLQPLTFEPESLSIQRNLYTDFDIDQGKILIDASTTHINWYHFWQSSVFTSGVVKNIEQLSQDLHTSITHFQQKTARSTTEIILIGMPEQIKQLAPQIKEAHNLPVTIVEKYRCGNYQFKNTSGLALKQLGLPLSSQINLLDS